MGHTPYNPGSTRGTPLGARETLIAEPTKTARFRMPTTRRFTHCRLRASVPTQSMFFAFKSRAMVVSTLGDGAKAVGTLCWVDGIIGRTDGPMHLVALVCTVE